MADALAALAADVADAKLGNRVAFAASMGEGRSVTETQRTSKAAVEVEALAGEVLARLLAG